MKIVTRPVYNVNKIFIIFFLDMRKCCHGCGYKALSNINGSPPVFKGLGSIDLDNNFTNQANFFSKVRKKFIDMVLAL